MFETVPLDETVMPKPKTIYSREYRILLELLRNRREKKGLSQTDVAKALGWTQRKVSYSEAGASRMDVLEYVALARALGLSPARAFALAESTASRATRKR